MAQGDDRRPPFFRRTRLIRNIPAVDRAVQVDRRDVALDRDVPLDRDGFRNFGFGSVVRFYLNLGGNRTVAEVK